HATMRISPVARSCAMAVTRPWLSKVMPGTGKGCGVYSRRGRALGGVAPHGGRQWWVVDPSVRIQVIEITRNFIWSASCIRDAWALGRPGAPRSSLMVQKLRSSLPLLSLLGLVNCSGTTLSPDHDKGDVSKIVYAVRVHTLTDAAGNATSIDV